MDIVSLLNELKELLGWIGNNPVRWWTAILVLTAVNVWKLKDVAQTIYQSATTSRLRDKHHELLVKFFDALTRESLFDVYKRLTKKWVLNIDLKGNNPASPFPWKWSSETFAFCILVAAHYIFALIIAADWYASYYFLVTKFKTDVTTPFYLGMQLVIAGLYIYIWDSLFYIVYTRTWTIARLCFFVVSFIITYIAAHIFVIENSIDVFILVGGGIILLLLFPGWRGILLFFLNAVFTIVGRFLIDHFHEPLHPESSFHDYMILYRRPFENAILYYIFIVSFYDWVAINAGRYFLTKASVAQNWLDVTKHSLLAVLMIFVSCAVTIIIANIITGESPAVLLNYLNIVREKQPEQLFQDVHVAKAVSIYVMSITVLVPFFAFCALILLEFLAKISSPIAKFVGTWMQELLSQEGERGRTASSAIIQLSISSALVFALLAIALARN